MNSKLIIHFGILLFLWITVHESEVPLCRAQILISWMHLWNFFETWKHNFNNFFLYFPVKPKTRSFQIVDQVQPVSFLGSDISQLLPFSGQNSVTLKKSIKINLKLTDKISLNEVVKFWSCLYWFLMLGWYANFSKYATFLYLYNRLNVNNILFRKLFKFIWYRGFLCVKSFCYLCLK